MRSATTKAKHVCGHAEVLLSRGRIVPKQSMRLSTTVSYSVSVGAERAAMLLDGYYEIFRGIHERREWKDGKSCSKEVKIGEGDSKSIFSMSVSGILNEMRSGGLAGGIHSIASLLKAFVQEQEEVWRPMTPLERVKRFPNAMYALLEDCVEYQNINDAKDTPRNAWSKLRRDEAWSLSSNASKEEKMRAQALAPLLPGSNKFHYGEDHLLCSSAARNGAEPRIIKRVPWRQYAKQRQVVQDLEQMTFLAIFWIPPIVGWIPTILAIVAPRQAFSRHFHNSYEVVQFALAEQEERRDSFDRVVQECLSFKSSSLVDNLKLFLTQSESHSDSGDFAAHKVKDPIGLYKAMFESSSIFQGSRLASLSGDLDQLPVKYIRNLGKAMGLSGSLTPASLLRPKLRRALATIAEDDAQLLMERHDHTECTMLCDREVMDACQMRNLLIVFSSSTIGFENGPEAVDYDEMRKYLTEHLRCMRLVSQYVVQQQIPKVSGVYGYCIESEMAKEKMGLFATHLSILRHYYGKRTIGSSKEEGSRQYASSWSLFS